MTAKKIFILSILLAIFTMGAVCAAADASDDINATAEDVCDDAMLSAQDIECFPETDEGVSGEMLSTYNQKDQVEISELSNDDIIESESIKEESHESGESTPHYGYWVNSIDMVNVNLTDMSNHGVTDLFLNHYSYVIYNQSTIESFISDAADEGIKIHIWAQIFYSNHKWVLPIVNGTVNQDYFDEKIAELEGYANTQGVAGIHFDYLRFSGSARYNRSADQNPGGMEAISEFVNQATMALRQINPNLTLSAALMPETDRLGSVYGYDYDVISEKMDAIIPMVYTGNFRQNATWVEQTTRWFKENSKGAEIWTGLQGYTVNDVEEEHISNSPHSQMSIEINSALAGGSKGAIVFRYGVCDNIDFINLPIDEYEFSTFNNLDYVISCSQYLALLHRDFTFNSTHDGGYVNGIGIHRDNLTIDGNNHIINASSLARIFNVTGSNITFRNIVFVRGCSNNGGALHVTGSDVRIVNCTFIDNNATVDGGAVYVRAPNAIIADSRFINNTAVYNGAVYMNSVNAVVVNSYFENNTADTSAGAIGWARKANGTVDNCIFISNSAHNEGGGAVFWNRGLDGKIINSIFEDNSGEFNGSAIYWSYGDNGIISNCTFINNNASVSGGALYIKGTNVTVGDCEFTGNAAVYGGAIYAYEFDELNIVHSKFKDNSVDIQGGAIYLNGIVGESLASILNSTFNDNKAIINASDGGAIFADCTLIVKDSRFKDNYAEDGGAIYINKSGLIYNSTFRNQNAEYGAAIFSEGTVEIYGCEFSKNKAFYGGAVYGSYNLTLIENSLFHDNRAGGGGAVCAYLTSVRNSTFTANLATLAGGALYVNEAIGITDSNFTGNLAKDLGGALYVENTFAVNNSQFGRNNAEDGGAIYLDGENGGSISNTIFVDNNATNGGAVYLGFGNNRTLSNVSFINNTAQSGGGMLSNGNLTLNGVTFKNNTAADGNNDISLNGNATMKSILTLDVIGIEDNIYSRTVSIAVNATCDIPVDGGNVSIMINNKSYVAHLRNGTATVEIPDLNAGPYSGDMAYDGDEKYISNVKTIDFTVLKQNATIQASDKAYVINYGDKYFVTLKDADGKAIVGKKITFTLNGKEIGSSATNAEGVATVTLSAKILKAAKAGRKNLVIKFSDANYNSASKTVSITVNKEKAKLTAKKKSFKKSKKVKKYVVVLKNSKGKAIKGVKLTLKIKNKKFKAKTNRKGKATFKIKKLTKKGKSTAKITFKGNRYYKSVTKKAKITIK